VAATAVGVAKVGGLGGVLKGLTDDPSSAVQVSAIFGILANGGEIDRSPLGQVLMQDPSASAKRHAVDVLGMLGDRSAKPLLRAAAKERFGELSPAQLRLLHIQISAALVKLGEDAERPVIIAALYPSQPEELEATVLAIQCIGGLKDSSAAAHLINLADYKDRSGKKYPPEVRLAVAAALAQLGMPEGSFVAEEYVHNQSATVRSQVAFVYGETKGSKNGARLEQLLNDPDAQVRVAAAAAVLKSLSRR
jgi:HEAT repeat protein